MKKLILTLILLAGVTSPAFAAAATNATITKIFARVDGLVIFTIDSAQFACGAGGADVNQARFTATTPAQRNVLSIATAAFLSGKKVTIFYSQCEANKAVVNYLTIFK